MDVTPDETASLESVIDGTVEDKDAAIAALEDDVINADEVVDDASSTLEASLGSESQGLLAGLEFVLGETVTKRVDSTIEAADDAALAQFFDVGDGGDVNGALAEARVQQDKQQRLGLQQFFLSMGLAVVIESNAAGDTSVIAIRLPVPSHMGGASLPGSQVFDDRAVRFFKVGEGAMGDESDYADVVSLSGVEATLLGDSTTGDFQSALDEAVGSFIKLN